MQYFITFSIERIHIGLDFSHFTEVRTPVAMSKSGLYSGQIEIWTSQKMAKNQDKSGQFNNFPAQAARKVTKSGQNRDRFY